jgi:hypothetical protein
VNEARLANLLGLQIVPAILSEMNVTDAAYAEELERFYGSRIFVILSDPSTALWHLSPATLAQMYNDELAKGRFEIPEEQS